MGRVHQAATRRVPARVPKRLKIYSEPKPCKASPAWDTTPITNHVRAPVIHEPSQADHGALPLHPLNDVADNRVESHALNAVTSGGGGDAASWQKPSAAYRVARRASAFDGIRLVQSNPRREVRGCVLGEDPPLERHAASGARDLEAVAVLSDVSPAFAGQPVRQMLVCKLVELL